MMGQLQQGGVAALQLQGIAAAWAHGCSCCARALLLGGGEGVHLCA